MRDRLRGVAGYALYVVTELTTLAVPGLLFFALLLRYPTTY